MSAFPLVSKAALNTDTAREAVSSKIRITCTPQAAQTLNKEFQLAGNEGCVGVVS